MAQWSAITSRASAGAAAISSTAWIGCISATFIAIIAMKGMTSTVTAPAATSTEAISGDMTPALTVTEVTATMSGSAVTQYRLTLTRDARLIALVSLQMASAARIGTPRTSSSMTMKPTIISG